MAQPWNTTTCACTAVRRAGRALTRVYDDALRPAGLATTQFSLLAVIHRAPGPLTLGELATAQVMDRTTLTRALAPLVRDGLVEVRTGADRRTRLVALTPAGNKALEAARPLWRAAQDQIAATAGPESLQHLLNELAILVHQIRQP